MKITLALSLSLSHTHRAQSRSDWAILWYSQSDDDGPQEDIARFGYKINMKVKATFNFLKYLWHFGYKEPGNTRGCWRRERDRERERRGEERRDDDRKQLPKEFADTSDEVVAATCKYTILH